MPNINITVAGKIATNMTPGVVVVCGNGDYTVNFDFDNEWAAEAERIARFAYTRDGKNYSQDKPFTGNSVAMPAMKNVSSVLVGVYTANMRTTTPAKVLCDRSILCGDPVEEIAPETWDTLMAQATKAETAAAESAAQAAASAKTAAEKAATADQALSLADQADKKVDTLREVVSKFHSNIVETAAGEVIALSDASDIELAGLHIYGKTTQNGTPTPETPVPLESVGDGGSVTTTVCGKNLFCQDDKMVPSTKNEVGYEINGNAVRVYTTVAGTRAGIRMYDIIRLKKGVTYRFSAMVNGIVSGTPGLAIRNADTYVYIKRDAVSSAGVLSFTYTPDEDVNAWLYVLCTSGDSEDGDVTFSDIQFETGSAVTEYEPYKEGGSATVTPVTGTGESLKLPGIPVSSGGSHKDANGKAWICDEVDFEQGVYVQRVGVLVLNGTQGRYSDSQGVFILDGLENAAPKIYDENFALCTHYAYGAYPNTSMPNMTFKVTLSSGVVNLYIKDSRYTTTQAFKDAFAASPVTVLYQLENSVQHMLTAEELAQYATLHTNYPNTTVYNDAGAHMEVKYVADTKLYVDNKFAELSAALLNQ